MKLEAVWLKNGKEVFRVSPVLNIVCDDSIHNISDIEVYDGVEWHSRIDCDGDDGNFKIEIKRD